MNVFSFTGVNFSDIEECFSGWMSRTDVGSGEIFEAKTVEDRLDMTSNSNVCVPLIFDLEKRKAIFADLSLTNNMLYSKPNNVETHMSSLALLGHSVENMRKTDLHTLFSIHADARGDIVRSKKDADIIFSVRKPHSCKNSEKYVTPFDMDKIVAEYV